jgi:dihydrofolate reductase
MEGDHIPAFLEQIKEYQVVLMGGNTYRYGFQFGLKPGEPGYKGIKHIVFSQSLDFVSTPEVELVRENPVEYVKKLKSEIKGKIWLCGGGELAGGLLEHELIDTFKLKVNPTLAGAGIRLFGKCQKAVSTELVDCITYKSGVIVPTYHIKY